MEGNIRWPHSQLENSAPLDHRQTQFRRGGARKQSALPSRKKISQSESCLPKIKKNLGLEIPILGRRLWAELKFLVTRYPQCPSSENCNFLPPTFLSHDAVGWTRTGRACSADRSELLPSTHCVQRLPSEHVLAGTAQCVIGQYQTVREAYACRSEHHYGPGLHVPHLHLRQIACDVFQFLADPTANSDLRAHSLSVTLYDLIVNIFITSNHSVKVSPLYS